MTVRCPACGKTLRAADSMAGKQVKCPHCGQVMLIPEPVEDAEEVVDRADAGGLHGARVPEGLGSPPEAAAQPQQRAAPGSQERRPCPVCGEMIVATAVKCRYCGELFDATLRRAGVMGPGIEGVRGEDPNATTIFVLGLFGLLCCGPLGIAAWLMGNTHRQSVRAGLYRESGLATAGWVLGIIATCLMAFGLLVFVVGALTGG